jgi:hypothetical protein
MATPNLGYENRASTSIDTFNKWFRAQPQYYAKLAEMGQDPNNVHLSDSQKQQMVRLAQSLGAVVDEGGNGQEVDESGNFRATGHKLRNGLIVAGIAGAALLTAGLAGAFAPAGGAVASTASTGLGAVEGGAFGLSDAALAGLGTGAMGAVGVPTAGAGIAGLAAGLGPEGVAEGSSVAGLTGSALPEIGGEAGTIAGSGLPAAGSSILSTGDKLAKLASGLKGIGGAAETIAGNGQDPALAGISSANAAAQAAKNRILAAQVDQGGPAADKQAISNMRTAGLISNFKDTSPSPYGSPGITLGQPTRDLASAFQQELLKRQAAGKSLTASGVPDPTQQELDDEAKARAIANGGSGIPGTAGNIINGINTGARIASLAPGVIKGARDIWSLF